MAFPPLTLLRPAHPDIPALRDAGDIDGLIELLSHPDQEVQEQAARALATVGEQATRYLTLELDHVDPGARLGIVEALGDTGDPAAVPALIRALRGEKSSEVRWAITLALGNAGDPAAIPPLVQALRDPDKYVRFGTAMALGKLGWEPAGEDRAYLLIARQEWDSLPAIGADAAHPLLWATRDPDPSIRAKAVDLLGALGDARGADACDLVLRDPDSEVRWRAVLAFPRCGIPLMHLPLGLVRRPRKWKNPVVASLLNLFFLGLGYSYLERWYGLIIFQVNMTTVVLLSLVVGPFYPYLVSYIISAFFAVQTWFLARRLAEERMG
ncbi:MAG: HEAT repeat domain-containing protein [Methanomicrobiales archaeon]|nr:HEAT repeat domain-containing protein [Methanomicrobiales archaeon]